LLKQAHCETEKKAKAERKAKAAKKAKPKKKPCQSEKIIKKSVKSSTVVLHSAQTMLRQVHAAQGKGVWDAEGASALGDDLMALYKQILSASQAIDAAEAANPTSTAAMITQSSTFTDSPNAVSAGDGRIPSTKPKMIAEPNEQARVALQKAESLYGLASSTASLAEDSLESYRKRFGQD